MRTLTDAQQLEVAELYATGFSERDIAVHLGVGDWAIRRALSHQGVASHHNNKLTPEQVGECVRDYPKCSTLELGKRYGVCQQTISNILQRAGVQLLPKGGRRHLPLREDVFDQLTDASAYWLGVLATDGCVTGEHGNVDQLRLTLKETDKGHVEAFRTFLESGHAITLVEWRQRNNPGKVTYGWQFAVRSKRLVAAVGRFGILPRKTENLVISPEIADDIRTWRGAVDGDGHVGIHKSNQGPQACLNLSSASIPFLEQFRDFLRRHGVRGDWSITEVTGECMGDLPKWRVSLGCSPAADACALLYAHPGPALSRKSIAAADVIRRSLSGELTGTKAQAWRNESAEQWIRTIEHAAAVPGSDIPLPRAGASAATMAA